MRICYVDEAGCTGALPAANSGIQPVFVVCGVDLPVAALPELTRELLELKRRFFPALAPEDGMYLGWILAEVKGAELRRRATEASRRRSRHALGFLGEALALLERHDARLHGRVWVKGIGLPFNGRSVYTYSLQYICGCFHRSLESRGESGIVICDSRNKGLNTVVSHSIFTQKFRASGDPFPRMREMPTFGHSENHAGVQLADLVCSAFLFPMAVHAYCRGHLASVHVRDYGAIAHRFGARIEALQVRWPEVRNGKPRLAGGITVDDKVGMRSRGIMFPHAVRVPSIHAA